MNERVGSSARSRSAKSGVREALLIGLSSCLFPVAEGRFLGDAAERVLVAVLACFRAALGIDACIALRETAARLLQVGAPRIHELQPIAAILPRGLPRLVE